MCFSKINEQFLSSFVSTQLVRGHKQLKSFDKLEIDIVVSIEIIYSKMHVHTTLRASYSI